MSRIEFDGGSNPNPGPCAGAYVILDSENRVVAEGGEYVPDGTNNIGEYTGLIAGLEKAYLIGIESLSIQGDSLLVISQVTGKWKVNNEKLKELCEKAKALIKKFKNVEFTHVLRAKNAYADSLSTLTLKRRKSWDIHNNV
jgi:ribonuclease HI